MYEVKVLPEAEKVIKKWKKSNPQLLGVSWMGSVMNLAALPTFPFNLIATSIFSKCNSIHIPTKKTGVFLEKTGLAEPPRI